MIGMTPKDLRKDMALKFYDIPVLWSDEHTKLDYFKKPISDTLIQNWREMGYTHENHNGYLYDQSDDRVLPLFTDQLAQNFQKLKNIGFAFYKMEQMTIMPPHVDEYEAYSKIFNVDPKDVIRVLIFLEDWQPGHCFEIDGKPFTGWKAGACIEWTSEEHSAANIGITPRYTLQLTGHV